MSGGWAQMNFEKRGNEMGAERNKVERITSGQPVYPARLKEIKDFPKELFYIGDLKVLRQRCLAIVGSRKTTQYGRNMAVSMARRLAERGVTVVSGMALGIDTCAHQGALRGGGGTVAVLGCGVDVCYPTENRKLKEEIERAGLVVSEYPPGTEPERYYFPQRNRIISGLAEAVVVVQAGGNSGALITAELAAEQGREVFAVPGNIDSLYNLGSNKLIKEGASPVISVDDVLEPFGLNGITEEEAERLLSETERRIYNMIRGSGEMTIDDICRRLEKPPAYVSSIVAVMEMKGVVFSALGKIFVAKG